MSKRGRSACFVYDLSICHACTKNIKQAYLWDFYSYIHVLIWSLISCIFMKQISPQRCMVIYACHRKLSNTSILFQNQNIYCRKGYMYRTIEVVGFN